MYKYLHPVPSFGPIRTNLPVETHSIQPAARSSQEHKEKLTMLQVLLVNAHRSHTISTLLGEPKSREPCWSRARKAEEVRVEQEGEEEVGGES